LIQRIVFFIALLLQTIIMQAQILRRPVAAGYTGMGAYSINHTDAFSFTANTASLAQLKNVAAGLFTERRFMLAELNSYAAVAAVPTKSGNFALKANYSGFTDYNETQLGLAYGRKLGNKVDVGAQFNYNGIQIAGYGNAAAISFELGTILHLTDRLHTGLHINNPVGGKFGKDQQEKLSAVYTVGMGYDASEKFLLSAEVQKEEDQPINVNAGFQYKIIPQLLVRAGMSSATSSAWAGVGISLKSLRLDVVASYHPQLGVTPGLLLLFNGANKQNK
jgi:hypothetical protein